MRDEADSTAASVSFDVDNPERTHSRGGGMCYEGGTVLALAPARPEGLAEAVEAVLQAGPYRYGDWFDLPMPLFLVHDDETDDTFRVAVRDGRVELHARSATTASGLRAFYERLADQVEGRVRVEREEQAT
ncbi:hypothetical protein [Halosegnis sp.]|uniref:hypothetical protein n=1 Tax=Halosegnis sp. TaxID=2864959 RepID=UPI0035D3F1DC